MKSDVRDETFRDYRRSFPVLSGLTRARLSGRAQVDDGREEADQDRDQGLSGATAHLA
jgi:hypothetical protein